MTDSWTSLGKIAVIMALAALAAGGISDPASAGDEEEYFIQHALQKYFDLPQSARALGMGGAIRPVETGAAALFGNPAGLARVERAEAALSYGFHQISGEEFLSPGGTPQFDDIDEDLDRWSLQAAFPLSKEYYATLGVGVSFYDTDVDDSVDTETDGWRLHLAYAGAVNEDLDLGIALSYLRDKEENDFADYEMDSGWLIEPGLMYRVNDNLILGLSLFLGFGATESDIVTGLKGDGDRRSVGVEAGLGWQAGEKTLIAASLDLTSYDHDADVEGIEAGENGHAIGVHLGIEQTEVFEWLDLRAGYRFQYIDYDFAASGVVTALSDDIDIHALSAGFTILPCDYFSLDGGMEYRFVGDDDFSGVVRLNFFF
jgi:hypothetical protein